MNGRMLRSGNPQFANDFADAARGQPQLSDRAVMVWARGDGKPVHYRRGTTDLGRINSILLKRKGAGEYQLSDEMPHSPIPDIDGNIGVTGHCLAHFNFDACNKAIAGQFREFLRRHSKVRF